MSGPGGTGYSDKQATKEVISYSLRRSERIRNIKSAPNYNMSSSRANSGNKSIRRSQRKISTKRRFDSALGKEKTKRRRSSCKENQGDKCDPPNNSQEQAKQTKLEPIDVTLLDNNECRQVCSPDEQEINPIPPSLVASVYEISTESEQQEMHLSIDNNIPLLSVDELCQEIEHPLSDLRTTGDCFNKNSEARNKDGQVTTGQPCKFAFNFPCEVCELNDFESDNQEVIIPEDDEDVIVLERSDLVVCDDRNFDPVVDKDIQKSCHNASDNPVARDDRQPGDEKYKVVSHGDIWKLPESKKNIVERSPSFICPQVRSRSYLNTTKTETSTELDFLLADSSIEELNISELITTPIVTTMNKLVLHVSASLNDDEQPASSTENEENADFCANIADS